MKNKITPSFKNELIKATLHSEYDFDNKESFHKMGQKFLKELALTLGLGKGSFQVKSNRGGIAVSGEIALHSENYYVQLSKSFCGFCFMFRGCNGVKDYCGRNNHYLTQDQFMNKSLERIAIDIREACDLFVLIG